MTRQEEVLDVSSGSAAVEVRGAVKHYGDNTVLNHVSLTVPRGVPTALLGPSGCGKTTTLRAIAGLVELDEGEIWLDGVDVRGRRPPERNVGLVFQSYALFPHMSVERNIEYGLRRRGVARTDRKRIVTDALALVRLDGAERRYPRELSGGEQQRVALARALVMEPRVMLLDEPLSNLDAKLRTEMRAELKRIFGSVDTTPLIVTHDQSEALSLGERVIIMNRGEVEQVGTPTEIYESPRTKFVGDFIGEMNWVPGKYRGQVGDDLWKFEATEGAQILTRRPPPGADARIEVGIRPERIRVLDRLSRPDPVTANGTNLLRGVVRRFEVVGGRVELLIVVGDRFELRATDSNTGRPLPGPGEEVSIVVSPDHCLPVAVGDQASAQH